MMCVQFLAERYYVTFGYWHRSSVCESVDCNVAWCFPSHTVELILQYIYASAAYSAPEAQVLPRQFRLLCVPCPIYIFRFA